MSSVALGRKMGIGRAQVGQTERLELADRITLKQLRRAAEALGCELQYRLVPREPWDVRLRAQAERRARALVEATAAQMGLSGAPQSREAREAAIAAEADDLLRRLPRDLWDQ